MGRCKPLSETENVSVRCIPFSFFQIKKPMLPFPSESRRRVTSLQTHRMRCFPFVLALQTVCKLPDHHAQLGNLQIMEPESEYPASFNPSSVIYKPLKSPPYQ